MMVSRPRKTAAERIEPMVERRDHRRRLLRILAGTPALDARTLARASGLELRQLLALLHLLEAEGVLKRIEEGRGIGYALAAGAPQSDEDGLPEGVLLD